MNAARAEGRRRITIAGLVAFFLALFLLTWALVWSEATRKIDRLLHDVWVKTYQRETPPDVVIAAIDTYSLDELGRWPWPRDQQAILLEKLARLDVRAVVVDVLYTEPSTEIGADSRLASALERIPITVLPVLTEGGGGRILQEALPAQTILREMPRLPDLGHVVLPIDDDGIVRRVFLKSGFNQAHWPSLAAAALDAMQGLPNPLPGTMSDTVKDAGYWVADHEVLIPFYGANGTFKRISAVDIMRDKAQREQLADKIVFVGLTTTGLGDVVPTPVSALDQPVPGVEIHANIFSALRDGSLVTRSNNYLSLVLAAVLIPVMLFVYSRAPPEWSLVSALLGASVPITISYLLYHHARLWYPPLAASVPLLMSYLIWSRHRLMYINRFLEREQSKSAHVLSERESNGNEALINFFKTAQRHLPIKAWRFTTRKEQFTGGHGLPQAMVAGIEPRWSIRNGVYSRRYPRSGDLRIELLLNDLEKGSEITSYIDSLARVRSRDNSTRLTGSVERLQSNAQGLREQLDKLRSIKVFSDSVLAGSPAGFAVWNAAGECIRANDLTYKLVPDFQRRGDLLDFISCLGIDWQSNDIAAQIDALLFEKATWQLSFSRDESEVVINFNALGSKLSERLICASIIDVSDIRTAERARAEMVDYLSHDLRSPLISALYLLEENADPRIEQNIQHSLTMMDDLLNVARADSLSETRFEPVLLNAVLDNALNQLLPQALMESIRFDLTTVDDDLWVVGDAASLERAITNIVGNAIKYSPASTTISINLSGENGFAILTVDDEGVGISPDMLDVLFTRFKRDTKKAGDVQGIGLGLALVSRVVGLHHGNVSASNLEKGTRITLKLPLENDSTV